jgi:selenocysteine lyase/cysteine desulfurase
MPKPYDGAFSVPEDVHYLNAAYMTPLPRAVEEAGLEGMAHERAPWTLGVEDFFRHADRIRRAFAGLLGDDRPGRVAVVPAVSYGAAVVARNLELGPDRTVVLVEGQFPSHVYAWDALARREGAELVTVARPAAAGEGPVRTARTWSERILASIDARTALVALPQAHWADGTLFDLEPIGRRAREVGAAFVIDGTQTVGAHPFDVARIRPDAVLCAGYKWLLGPYGLSVVWLGPRFEDARPIEESWMAREGSADFAALVDYREEYRPDASRLDAGGHSTFILAPMLATALELLSEWGVAAVAGHCAPLTSRAAAGAAALGCTVESDEGRCSNIVGLRLPSDWEMERVQRRLAEARVLVSRRGDGLRVSPHLYNGEADVDALLRVLEAEASGG